MTQPNESDDSIEEAEEAPVEYSAGVEWWSDCYPQHRGRNA